MAFTSLRIFLRQRTISGELKKISLKTLLQIASADKREDSAVKAPSSLSPEQIERIQAQKAKALAIRKSRTVSTLHDAGSPHTSAADEKVKDRSVCVGPIRQVESSQKCTRMCRRPLTTQSPATKMGRVMQ